MLVKFCRAANRSRAFDPETYNSFGFFWQIEYIPPSDPKNSCQKSHGRTPLTTMFAYIPGSFAIFFFFGSFFLISLCWLAKNFHFMKSPGFIGQQTTHRKKSIHFGIHCMGDGKK
jgi:hypothetical protein